VHSPGEFGAHNPEVKRLRALLRDASRRRDEGVFVIEGPRVLDAALAAGAQLQAVYVAADASPGAAEVAARAADSGVALSTLAHGVASRIADTVHSQGVFAVASKPNARTGVSIGDLASVADASSQGGGRGRGLLVAVEQVGDPGNAGTILRSAAAAGADGVIFGPGSVDAYNPKVVRASAGACFACPVVEDVPIVEILEALGGAGWQRLGAAPAGGSAPETFDFRRPTCLVLGHETAGLSPDLPLDGQVSIPMVAGESLNLAMATTVLLFEAARQGRSGSSNT
jgi:TrmH family RNA methyltransferase